MLWSIVFGVASDLEVFGPVQIFDTKGDAVGLVFFLRRASIGQLNDANIRRLPREVLRHFLHWLTIELDVGHECDAFFAGELTEHLAHDALLIDMQAQHV